MTITRYDLKQYGDEWGIPATPAQVAQMQAHPTAALIAQLRTHLDGAAKPGLTGVQALAAARGTLGELADAVRLMEQRWADREAQRYGAMLRHMGTAEEIYAAEQQARQSNPELWEGVRG